MSGNIDELYLNKLKEEMLKEASASTQENLDELESALDSILNEVKVASAGPEQQGNEPVQTINEDDGNEPMHVKLASAIVADAIAALEQITDVEKLASEAPEDFITAIREVIALGGAEAVEQSVGVKTASAQSQAAVIFGNYLNRKM